MDSTDRRRLVVLVAGGDCLLAGVAADTASGTHSAAPGVAGTVALAAGTSVLGSLRSCGAHVLLERTKIIRGLSKGGCANAVTRHPWGRSVPVAVGVLVVSVAEPVRLCEVSMTLSPHGDSLLRDSMVS